MTICISAIANEGGKEIIIFATDHMISTQIGKFEHAIKKYKTVGKNSIAMLAGNSLLFNDCLTNINLTSNFFEVREIIFQNMNTLRKKIVKNEVYNVYGIDDTFIKESLRQPVPNKYVDTILAKISEFRLSTQILLIGFHDGKAQMCEITEDGLLDFRDIHFHAIGSGTIQAINTLLFQKHSQECDIKTALYNVFKAKKNAEAAEGVGRETEILIFRNNRTYGVSRKDLDTLQSIYDEELGFGKSHTNLNTLNVDDILGVPDDT